MTGAPTYFTEDHALSMTLRDYFAAKAMAVVMPPVLEEIRKRNISDADVTKLKRVSAEACYGIADQMLEARK
jgi:hypothetical protein